jgi:Type I phosphodiesterase / nucleotide pyrophosphatase
MTGAYRGGGVIQLGSRRSLAVLAVDGLGYRVAAKWLAPDALTPLTTCFPSTTTAALMSSLTGLTPSEHGVIGVQYLHPDGRRGYNCLTGEAIEPSRTGVSGAAISGAAAHAPGPFGPSRVSPDPEVSTAFLALRELGVPSFSLPGELAGVAPAWRNQMFRGSTVLQRWSGGPAGGPDAPPVAAIVDAVSRDLCDVLDDNPGAVVWAYLNLDDHLHRHGADGDIEQACRAIDALASRLAERGTTVLLYSDHGCAVSAPSAATMAAFDARIRGRPTRSPSGCAS